MKTPSRLFCWRLNINNHKRLPECIWKCLKGSGYKVTLCSLQAASSDADSRLACLPQSKRLKRADNDTSNCMHGNTRSLSALKVFSAVTVESHWWQKPLYQHYLIYNHNQISRVSLSKSFYFFMHVKQHFKLKSDAGRFGLYDVGSCCMSAMLWGQNGSNKVTIFF